MFSLSDLPALNASLNGTSAVLLATGYFLIRRKKVKGHKLCMSLAFLTSTLFLVSYLVYHYHHGATAFAGPRWVRPIYFSILVSHTMLAAAVVPLAIITLRRAWKEQFARHMRIARWTLPIWLYVSVTGVLIYLMLYQIFPA